MDEEQVGFANMIIDELHSIRVALEKRNELLLKVHGGEVAIDVIDKVTDLDIRVNQLEQEKPAEG
jgi:hypothetical protein